MLTPEILAYIIGLLGLGGVIFSIYNYFKDPQSKLEKDQAVSDKAQAEFNVIMERLYQEIMADHLATERRKTGIQP